MRPTDPAPPDAPLEPAPPDPPPSWITGSTAGSGAAPGRESAEQPRLTAVVVAEARRAARYAERAYQGPIGDLIGRELREYAEAGHELPPHAMGPRLVSLMAEQETRDPLPPSRAHTRLSSQYVPGTPLRWRYRSIADVEEPEADSP